MHPAENALIRVCGIAGVLDSAGPAPETVERQLRCLEHRGPDACGVFSRGAAVIGQNRLAVIDLVNGNPPITNEDRSVGAVLNGEIYNHRVLRDELRRQGHRLGTAGDTEVIAHLAESLDPLALVRRLHGMFAFAVWDTRRERLIIARDRLGKKPLYYWRGNGRLVFASEIKAVLVDPHVPRRMDADVLPAYLRFGYAPTPRTFFEGVQSLLPGHVLVAEQGEVRVERYWQPQVPAQRKLPPIEVSIDDAARMVRTRLTAAVQSRLEADVPIGAFLSGGIDSSAVVALMTELGAGPVRTFTIGFEAEGTFDERPHARVVAKRFGTEHTERVVKADAAGLIERLIWHHDQPFGDSSAVPTFLLCELAREQVTVALGGDGGDEVFGGYQRFAAALAAERLPALLGPLATRLGTALGAMPPAVRARCVAAQRFLTHAGRGIPDAYLEWVSYLSPAWREALIGAADCVTGEDYRRLWARSEGANTLARLLDLNLRTYLLDDLLPKTDRAAMAHGLEVRSPMLDHELVELVLRLPRPLLVRALARKRVLRAALDELLPAEILRRRKRGFAIPIDRWFRAELRSYLSATLGARDARTRDYVSSGALDALIASHLSGRAQHGQALWALVMLEAFLRREGW